MHTGRTPRSGARALVHAALLSSLLLWPGRVLAEGGLTPLGWMAWAGLQAIPSPTFTIDDGSDGSRLLVSFRWHITPISYSWSANELVSPVRFLKVSPVRRHAGSIELFAQPELALSDYRFSSLERLSLALGTRAYLPLDEYGEYLSLSVGAKYVLRYFTDGTDAGAAGGEVGIYTLFGMVGLQVSVLAAPEARTSFCLSLRYY